MVSPSASSTPTSTVTPVRDDGAIDDLPDQAFLYVGDISEVRAKAKAM